MIADGRQSLQNNNSKEAWKFIKQATFTNKKETTKVKNLKEINEYFGSIVSSNESAEDQSILHTCDGFDSFKFRKLHQNEMKTLLQRIDTNTSTGVDGIPARILKSMANPLAEPLTRIINASIEQRVFPEVWKKANVKPIYKKKGNRQDPNNYRPISILPVISRVFEKAMATQLYNYCEKNRVIPVEQFGFRKNSNCETALISAADSWKEAIDSGNMAAALLVDMSKAFDSVSHHKLILSLGEISCSLECIQWFASYLENRQQRVTQGTTCTRWMPAARGVPQGSCLSPLLFNIYVKDLPSATSSNCCQFADDVTESEQDNDISRLKTKLELSYSNLSKFCNHKDLKINPDKTQLIIFKNSRKVLPPDFSIIIEDIKVQPQQTVKLLGIVLDQHLTFRQHIDEVVTKCHGLLGALRRAAPCLPQELIKLF